MTEFTEIIFKSFETLTPFELYKILQLRNEVFVVEQNCVFQDADNKDLTSMHLLMMQEEVLVAYCRLLPPGLAYTEMSIGRIVNAPRARGTGAGKILVGKAIELCRKQFGKGPIRIGAQYYLVGFYQSFGFKQEGDIYIEDGIEHIEMVLG
jgi:ElaA protein